MAAAGRWTAGERWLAAGAAMLCFAVATITKADPDLWGHLRFGLDTLQAHGLTLLDPYSFTQDRPWVNHEWLSESMMGAGYRTLGVAGLALLKGALASATLVLVWSALRGTRFEARISIVALGVIGTIGITQTLRPHLWSLFNLAILCRVLLGHNPVRRRYLPLLFAFWANVHGGWIVGIAVLGTWVAVDAYVNPAARRDWAWILPACAVATLGTPYGWKLWDFVGQTVRPTRTMIEEWQPLWTLPPQKWLLWLAVVAVALWSARRDFSQRPQTLAVLAVLAYAALRLIRMGPFLALSALILLAPFFAGRWPSPSRGAMSIRRSDLAVVAGIFLAMAGLSIWIGSSSLRCISIDDVPQMPDREAARWLDGARSGRLVTFFNWGEYAIWHWGPALRVSMDGRRETIYSDERLAEHDAILAAAPEGLATLDQWRPEYVWLPAGSSATMNWLAGHGYRIEVDTRRSFIAVRAGLAPLAPPQEPALPVPGCFPG